MLSACQQVRRSTGARLIVPCEDVMLAYCQLWHVNPRALGHLASSGLDCAPTLIALTHAAGGIQMDPPAFNGSAQLPIAALDLPGSDPAAAMPGGPPVKLEAAAVNLLALSSVASKDQSDAVGVFLEMVTTHALSVPAACGGHVLACTVFNSA